MKNNKILKEIVYIVLLLLLLGSVYIINNVYLFGLVIKDYFGLYPVILSSVFISAIIVNAYLLPTKIRRVYVLSVEIILSMVTVANYFYINYFEHLFSWNDLVLSGEGMSFISSIFPLIDIRIISVIIYFFVIILLTFILTGEIRINFNKKSVILLIVYLVISLSIYLNITQDRLKYNVFNSWNPDEVWNNDNYYYYEWVDNVKIVKMVGIYEYLFKDLYKMIFTSDNISEAKKFLDENLSIATLSTDNDYYGLFKNKNLILIMLESMDDWQINEYSTPTIWKMKNEGINFSNHYSLTYITGKTSQSEFMANTGIYPKFNYLSPHYAYVNNNYVYSIANLFKNKGYNSNAFHISNGSIYNRGEMMISLGYENYYNYNNIGAVPEDVSFDTNFIKKAYPYMIQEEKFFDFWITISNHSAYTLEKDECNIHYNKFKKQFKNIKDETTLCGYAQAYETDLAIKYLIDSLEEDGLLDDTVIIAFSDHPNGEKFKDGETTKLNKTEMFIYNTSLETKEITTLTNTINILPMINNLFALDSPYFMTSYDPLTSNESYLLFDDLTIYENQQFKKVDKERLMYINISKNLLISDYYSDK